jgi:hypothetical protein
MIHNRIRVFTGALLLAVSASAAQTYTFRQGENGYTGATDLSVSSDGSGNGTTTRTSQTRVHLTSSYQYKALYRFDNLQTVIPAGSTVTAAKLTLIFAPRSSDFQLTGLYLKAPWDANSNSIGWLKRDDGLNWAAAGVTGAGSDYVSGKSFQTPNLTGVGNQTVTVTLDPATVQGWITNPVTNLGVLFTHEIQGKSASIYSSRSGTPAYRPLLSITVGATGGTGDSTAPTVSMTWPNPGMTVSGQFGVAAAASDNVGVAGVRFLVDGNLVGQEDSLSPYEAVLDTATLSAGAHTLAARARDAAGNITTSTAVPVTVIPMVTDSPLSTIAAPRTSGSISVKLYPTEGVKAAVPTLVTFGVPFPRGSVPLNGLNRIRVLRNGTEIPAYIGMLTPWRHLTKPQFDAKSVRVARVQLSHNFTNVYPGFDTITIEWGKSSRQVSNTTLQDPRTAWHAVKTGGFSSSDGVTEPDVYAVLPADFLALGTLTMTQMAPFDPSVTEARTSPTAFLAQSTWPGFTRYQTAAKNFFYTIINQDDPGVTSANQNPFRTDYEPWLFDRSATMFNLYFQSGFFTPLRQAVRNAQFYVNKLYPGTTVPTHAIGMLKLKASTTSGASGPNVAMYSYNESLAYTYWLTGDTTMLQPIDWVTTAQETNAMHTRWAPTWVSWTERSVGLRTLASVIKYEVTGDAAAAERIITYAGDLMWLQNGADNQIPSARRVDGGLYHTGKQAMEGPAAEFLASPWMTVYVLKPMVRAYGLTDDLNIAQFCVRLGNFWKAAARTDAAHEYGGGALTYTDYLTKYDGTIIQRGEADVEHALEVSSGMGWTYFFSRVLGTPDASLKSRALSLYTTYGAGTDYWTRPSGPASGEAAYRVSPWRKYNWEHSSSPSLAWLLQ